MAILYQVFILMSSKLPNNNFSTRQASNLILPLHKTLKEQLSTGFCGAKLWNTNADLVKPSVSLYGYKNRQQNKMLTVFI